MVVPASWLPRQLITEPSTPTKKRGCLHSNILIPPFAGCSRGDCRDNEQEFVLLSASVCVRKRPRLDISWDVNVAEVYVARQEVEMQVYALVIHLSGRAASPAGAVTCRG